MIRLIIRDLVRDVCETQTCVHGRCLREIEATEFEAEKTVEAAETDSAGLIVALATTTEAKKVIKSVK